MLSRLFLPSPAALRSTSSDSPTDRQALGCWLASSLRTGSTGLLVASLSLSLGASSLQAQSPESAAATASAASSVELQHLDPQRFPVPKELRPNVRFWTDIFSKHSTHHVVLHDEEDLDIVYAVLDFSEYLERKPTDAEYRRFRRKKVEETKDRYATALRQLGAGAAVSDKELGQRILDLFRHVPGGREKYRRAAQHLRTQSGLADTFGEAIQRSGRYLPEFERIFRQHDLPVDLTRMAFVESMFQEGARSKVGAGGMWQIMPATGRKLITISYELDERYDPFRAASAAARILSQNHDTLGNWPLAVTGYNYGVNGLRRAVKKFGTRDPGTILTRHSTRTFGFASRNFYASFVAAAQVYNNRQVYHPDVSPFSPLRFDIFELDAYASAPELADAAGVDLDELRDLNPAVRREIWSGDLFLPSGYALKVPEGSELSIAQAYADLGPDSKSARQAGLRYRVKRGDTLSAIASRYGTSVRALQGANGLGRSVMIRVGQKLLVPAGRRSATVRRATLSSPAARPDSGFHTVAPGDTLTRIASRYGTSVDALVSSNSLNSSHRIYPGQRLRIPGEGSDSARRHVVRAGQTLAQIARTYGVSVRALQEVNRLRGHLIYPQQVLVIP
ncbi:MAG: LysM peptidoglycan-binding domain-containing protein [Acidobacteriota bacterium]